MEKSVIKSFHNIIYNIDTAAHWTDRNFDPTSRGDFIITGHVAD